jgi:hypothetical protein
MSEMIERVARAIYENRNGPGCYPWGNRTKAHRAPYLADARAAIEAMPWRLDEVREELRLLMLKTPTTSERDTYPDGFHQGLAAAIGRLDAALATYKEMK